MEKFKNRPLKIKNSKIRERQKKIYVDLGPKRYLGPRDPIIVSMGYGGGGSKLKVRGTDFYPVIMSVCIHVDIDISTTV